MIERAVILSQRALRIDLVLRGRANSRGRRVTRPTDVVESGSGVLSEAEMSRRERDNIIAALQRTGWKISGAARRGGARAFLCARATVP